MKRWSEISALVEEALELPLEDQIDFLRRRCGEDAELLDECAALLEADAAAEGFLEGSAAERFGELLSGDGATEPEVTEGTPRSIGPYRILGELGHGGMGTVYAAERADGEYEQSVALKVMRRGLDSEEAHARFLRERQVLARLDHPHIARLLDGGSVDGRPYLVMELVEGLPIDEYCREHRLDVDARLDLFLQVLDAVDFAHRNLVLHRDLKPSNILVCDRASGQQEVKLLDFGIASLLDASGQADTRMGPGPMTPESAAPEQLAGEAVTTATDVYALGLILSTLLCGSRPGTAADRSGEARSLRSQLSGAAAFEPSHVASLLDDERAAAWSVGQAKLARTLRGDLDCIVQTALREAPEERYGTVAALRDDIVAHRAELPIQARPPSLGYLVGRFLSRHRLAAAVAAALAASVVLGLGGTLWQARAARAEAQRAETVLDLLVRTFQGADPDVARGESVTARQLLDEGARSIERELASQPRERAELQLVIASIYRSLGAFDPADRLLEAARPSLEGTDASFRVSSELGRLRIDQGRYDEAVDLFGAELERSASTDVERAELLHGLGVAQTQAGRFDPARRSLTEALDLLASSGADARSRTSDVLASLAELDLKEGDFESALEGLERVLAIRREIFGEPSVDVASALNDLGVASADAGRIEAAAEHLGEALGMRRRLFPEGHPSVAHSLRNLAGVTRRLGEYEEAESLYAESLELYRRTLGPEHPEVGMALNNLGVLRSEQGRFEDAADLFGQSLTVSRAALGARHPDLVPQVMSLAATWLRAGRGDEATRLGQEAVELAEEVLPASHPLRGVTALNLGQIHLRLGRQGEARRLLETAVERLRESLGDQHPNTALALVSLAGVEQTQGDLGSATDHYREALGVLRESLPSGHARIAETSVSLALALWRDPERAPDESEVRTLIEEAIAIYGEMEQSEGEQGLRSARAALEEVTAGRR